ncbi:MAG TPA: RraA family protein [Casimicrobiaceae bacterium]|nr:RraA family protein [Casimicrobiaceae bacterium]
MSRSSAEAPGLQELAALAAFDTPTICNALEVVVPERRGTGYTTSFLTCGFPDMKPIVGFARTARIRAKAPPAASAAAVRTLRHDYYRYMDAGPKPSIVIIQDLDGSEAGYGAFWGEVQSAIHRGLGALGVITNGSVRDIDQWAPGFQFLAAKIGPSHAYVNLVDFGGEVEVMGMAVRSGDIVHADRHGAVVVPSSAVRDLPAAAQRVAAREARILAVARAPECTAERLIDVFNREDEIH